MTDGEPTKSPLKKKIARGLMVGLGVLLLLAAASGGWYLYYLESKSLSDLKKDPSKIQELTQSEAKQLVARVGQLMELPEESPTVATVANAEELKKQEPFFKNSVNGDKVLIYTSIKKAILFRPSTGKIIEVAPINIGPSEQTGTPDQLGAETFGAPAATPKTTVATTPIPAVTAAPSPEATTPASDATPAL